MTEQEPVKVPEPHEQSRQEDSRVRAGMVRATGHGVGRPLEDRPRDSAGKFITK